ncbi:MAG: exodeoxyribonuclease VII small subunit [Corynebacterium sp.]|nr:exodeoxyribonuclease VII small subunit [Corynebacterium sp.]
MSNDVIGHNQGTIEFVALEELSYEQARDELADVVRVLESGQMSLDESLEYWERGEALAKYCEDKLAGAQQRIEQALAAAEDTQTQ